MKRFIAAWAVCLTLSLGSFGVLLLEDRTLGVPLPYSVPIAFAAMLGASPLLLVLARHLRIPSVERPVAAAAPRAPAAQEPVAPRRSAEGVVLLDMSRITRNGRAA